MKLIDKSAVIAEIEKLTTLFYPTLAEKLAYESAIEECKDIILNTSLEVKEVDYEREIGIYATKELLKKRNHSTGVFHLTQTDINSIAKHFFELGLKVNNPITAADRGTAEEVIVCLKHVEQEHCIDLTKEIQWLRDIVKKGE